MKNFENAKSYLNIFVSKKYNSLICWICTCKEKEFAVGPTLALLLWKDVLNSVTLAMRADIHRQVGKRGWRGAKISTCSL